MQHGDDLHPGPAGSHWSPRQSGYAGTHRTPQWPDRAHRAAGAGPHWADWCHGSNWDFGSHGTVWNGSYRADRYGINGSDGAERSNGADRSCIGSDGPHGTYRVYRNYAINDRCGTRNNGE